MEDKATCTEAGLQPTRRCWGEAELVSGNGTHRCSASPPSWPQSNTRKSYSQNWGIAEQSTGSAGEPIPCFSSFCQRHWLHTPPSSDFPGSLFAPCHLQHLLGPTKTAKNLLSLLSKGFWPAPTSMPKPALAHHHATRAQSLLSWAATHHPSCGFWTETERTFGPQTTFLSWLAISLINFHSQFEKFSKRILPFFSPSAVSCTFEFQGSLKQELGMNLPLF